MNPIALPDRGLESHPARASPSCHGNYCALGCRGFTGPIPPPLWDERYSVVFKRDKRTSASRGDDHYSGSRGPPRPPGPRGALACRTWISECSWCHQLYQFARGSLTWSGGGMIGRVTDGQTARARDQRDLDLRRAQRREAVARSQADGLRDEACPVRMLELARGTLDRAYNNVANLALWFLLHQLFDTPSQPRFGRDFRDDWESYQAYNEAFADAPLQEAVTGGASPRVLIQDYHLCRAAAVPGPAGRGRRGGRHRGNRLGAARLLPDAAGRDSPGAARPHPRRLHWGGLFTPTAGRHRVDGLSAAVLGADVSRTGLRAGPWPGRAGDLPRPRHRGHPLLGVDAPALRERAPARRRPGAHRRAPPAAGDRKLIVRVAD